MPVKRAACLIALLTAPMAQGQPIVETRQSFDTLFNSEFHACVTGGDAFLLGLYPRSDSFEVITDPWTGASVAREGRAIAFFKQGSYARLDTRGSLLVVAEGVPRQGRCVDATHLFRGVVLARNISGSVRERPVGELVEDIVSILEGTEAAALRDSAMREDNLRRQVEALSAEISQLDEAYDALDGELTRLLESGAVDATARLRELEAENARLLLRNRALLRELGRE